MRRRTDDHHSKTTLETGETAGPDAAKKSFEKEFKSLALALADTRREVSLSPHGVVIYKRMGHSGKPTEIDASVIVDRTCNICCKSFDSPWQARRCCESASNIPWPVTYHGEQAQARDIMFPSDVALIEFLGKKRASLTAAKQIRFHCPMMKCDFSTTKAPDERHMAEQHLLHLQTSKTKHPILCTIDHCGLFIKRPEDKLMDHLVWNHQGVTSDDSRLLKVSTPILLAVLMPDAFYQLALDYYVEQQRRGTTSSVEPANKKVRLDPAPEANLLGSKSSIDFVDDDVAPLSEKDTMLIEAGHVIEGCYCCLGSASKILQSRQDVLPKLMDVELNQMFKLTMDSISNDSLELL